MVNLNEEIERGVQAMGVLDEPIFREAVNTLRARYAEEWEATPARDTEGREQLWKLMKSLSAVEGHLKIVMETGKLARIQIQQESRAERLRKAW